MEHADFVNLLTETGKIRARILEMLNDADARKSSDHWECRLAWPYQCGSRTYDPRWKLPFGKDQQKILRLNVRTGARLVELVFVPYGDSYALQVYADGGQLMLLNPKGTPEAIDSGIGEDMFALCQSILRDLDLYDPSADTWSLALPERRHSNHRDEELLRSI
jgi:hypothetical protein